MQRKRHGVKILAASRKPRRHPIIRILLVLTGLMVLLEAAIIFVLQVITEQRKRHRQEGSFPHPSLDEVQVGDNRLLIYDYGRDLYDAMLAAIDGAQESIYLETYIWKDDEVGQAFKEHLTRKAAEGVEVFVIFDRFGNLVVPRAFKEFPPAIHTLAYQGVQRPQHLIDPRRYALEHRKVLVVDGKVAFLGGYNLGSLYATQWRDTHLRVEGPAAAHLAAEFVNFWERHSPALERIAPHRYPRNFDPYLVLQSNDAM